MDYTLTDVSAGLSWQYETERQLRTAANLYGHAHPRAALAVTMNGHTYTIRAAR